MSLIDQHSLVSTKQELQLFDIPPTQVTINRTYWTEVQPIRDGRNEGPFVFSIGKDPHLLHINKNYIHVVMRIVNGDGTPLVAAVPAGAPAGAAAVHPAVGPINLIGKTLWQQVKLFLNGIQVSDSGDKYPYKAYIETELNLGWDAKNSHQQAALYVTDDSARLDAANNSAHATRCQAFRLSRWVDVMAPLHIDLFMQEKMLLNNLDISLELYRNRDPFCLMCFDANPAYKIEIQSVKWYVQKVEVASSFALGLEAALQRRPAKYPIRRVTVTGLSVGEGLHNTPQTSLFTGQIPRRIIIGCVDADARIGNYAKCPFNFKHFSITEAKVTAGGQTYPSFPLTMDFANNIYMKPFVALFETLGMAHTDKGNALSRQKYANGWTLLGFDLSQDSDDGAHWELVREGTTTLELRFGNPVPAGGLEVIIYAEYDNMITLDRNRQPSIDYIA